MRVAIAASAGTTGGPATYAAELVRALGEREDTELIVVTDKPDFFDANADVCHVPLRSPWHQPLWDHWAVPQALKRYRYDVFHGTKGVLPFRAGNARKVVTIHDLAVEHQPETFSRAQRLHLKFETPHTVRSADRIVTVSQSTAFDIERFFPGTKDKVTIVPEAAKRSIRPATVGAIDDFRRRYEIDGPVVGYLGTVQPRKNLDLLAEAFRAAARERPWQLVIAGRRRPGYEPDCFAGQDARIRYIGEIADEDVAAFFGALGCMASPSSYEGFGLTFIEAMAAGCPVIGLANSSVPEVVGDAGMLVRSADAPLLAEAIETVMTDATTAHELSRRGIERAALFSWEETARLTRDVYESLL